MFAKISLSLPVFESLSILHWFFSQLEPSAVAEEAQGLPPTLRIKPGVQEEEFHAHIVDTEPSGLLHKVLQSYWIPSTSLPSTELAPSTKVSYLFVIHLQTSLHSSDTAQWAHFDHNLETLTPQGWPQFSNSLLREALKARPVAWLRGCCVTKRMSSFFSPFKACWCRDQQDSWCL